VCIDLAKDCPITKLRVASLPPSDVEPFKLNVGVDRYPVPLFVTSTAVTFPPKPNFVIAFAPDPPPPVIVMTGGDVYPEPPSLIKISFTIKPKLSFQFFAG